MVTPSGVVGTVTMGAVEGGVVPAVVAGTEVDMPGVEGGVVVSDGIDVGTLVDVAVGVELGGVELGGVVVADTLVDVEAELVDSVLGVLVDVELVDVELVVSDDGVLVVSDVVAVVDVIEVVEVVELVVDAITGGDSMIRGVTLTLSGGTVASGFLASILTSACCTRLANSAFC